MKITQIAYEIAIRFTDRISQKKKCPWRVVCLDLAGLLFKLIALKTKSGQSVGETASTKCFETQFL
jgi:hypothetical protein